MNLFLIRHGESWHGQRRVIGGPIGCTGLTPTGKAQAVRLRDRLACQVTLPDDVILLSAPWPRARETATILQPAVHGKLQIDERLRELDPGEADGLTWDEYCTRFGDFDLFAEPDRPFAPGGESYAKFASRVCDTLDSLAQTYPDSTVVAVAHGGTMVVSMIGLLGIPRPGTGAILKPDYTGLTIWKHTDHWMLERYNDSSHLEAQGATDSCAERAEQ